MQAQMMQQQQMMQQMMMQQGMANAVPGTGTHSDKAKAVIALKPKKKEDDKSNIVFVGGLRKSTTEDKVLGHFSKFGQVDNVDIKRLPDGDIPWLRLREIAIDKVLEAQSSHMIDNKWVAVKPHGGTSFTEAKNSDRQKEQSDFAKKAKKDTGPEDTDNYDEKWSENYLQAAAKMSGGDKGESSGSGDGEAAPENPMANMNMAAMMPMMMQMMQMMGG
eukprot:CAMPEP_0115153586 /NCGR_PEP_ID=MMETSP0227-20121206/66811_1 /TAXON_ID=89957 /ORGANISM="Polarella glacialis, Strain CCMP 1383" /LENGTH=217 /DNA_ID=CAMNT_0002564347 /DNA_START=78 /DNA_END=727 /DNA_ORIENTATION=-